MSLTVPPFCVGEEMKKVVLALRLISDVTYWLSEVLENKEPRKTKPKVEFCFIDVETTGLDPNVQEIVEIALIKTDENFDVLKQYQTRVFPKHIETAHPKALKINGYDPEIWGESALSAEQTIEQIKPLLDGAIIAGQNVKFDISFLKCMFAAENEKPNWSGYHSIDTASLALPYFLAGEIKGLRLRNICKGLGITNKNPHRAMGDAYASLEIARTLNSTYMRSI